MNSIRYVLFVAGLAVLAALALSRMNEAGLAETPTEIDLVGVESGLALENRHVTIGPHLRVYHYLAYEYEAKNSDVEEADRIVTDVYYPIISVRHPYASALIQLERDYGSLARVPRDVPMPDLESFPMLVHTTDFDTTAGLPDGISAAESITGIVRARPLSEQQSRDFEIDVTFPRVDRSTLLVLDEGRAPLGRDQELWLAGVGGGLTLVGGLAVAASRRRDDEPDAAPEHPETEASPPPAG